MKKKKKNPKLALQNIHPVGWDKKRLKEILRQFEDRRILVVGDVGVDRYTMGSVERISPEAPVPIVLVQEEKLKLGLAANVADNVNALGGIPLLTGIVGLDRGAEDFRELLKSSGIEAGYLLTDRSRRTVLKERVVSERQQLLRVDYESSHPLDAETERKVIQRIEDLIPRVDAVILEDYAKGVVTERVARAVFSAAKKQGKRVTVDPNAKTQVSRYLGASVLTPNTREAEALAGLAIRDEASLLEVGSRILKAAKAEHVIITRGKEGMAIFSAGVSKCRIIPTYAREVYDVSGAGDTVIAVLTLALASGASVEEATVLGNLAAGVEVGKRGTATVTPEEVRVAMEFFARMPG